MGILVSSAAIAVAVTIVEMKVHRQDFNLILMAESTLIILSMIVSTIAFRFILRPQRFNKDRASQIQELRDEMVSHAIHEVQQLSIPDEVKLAVSFDPRSQKGQTSLKEFWYEWTRMVGWCGTRNLPRSGSTLPLIPSTSPFGHSGPFYWPTTGGWGSVPTTTTASTLKQ